MHRQPGVRYRRLDSPAGCALRSGGNQTQLRESLALRSCGHASSLDQIGCFAKDVRDAAIVLEVLAGVDPRDSTSIPQPVPHYSLDLNDAINGMKLGLARG